MRYGFVIDHDRCIGCHACTVACKEEHNVPVGVFRTWVKYIEKGEFPNSSRHFGVMRCNHCDSAPCIEICPTQALFRRPDGIVDFDNHRCIGCKSCMQACPYDALYIDPQTNTAAKCNFCAHRIEMNLEPACVIVCPTQAIIAGDLDNPESPAGHILATQKVAARKPYKGTQPKLFYTGIEGDFLEPLTMERQPSYAFAERNAAASPPVAIARRLPGAARVVYDVAHPAPWGWIPALYLWTKAAGAGLLMITGGLAGLGWSTREPVIFQIISPAAALFLLVLTAVLLIADLKRPDRFYYILIKPNPRSWLVWGTWILMLAGAVAAGWLACGLMRIPMPDAVFWLAAALGVASASYSGFLFAQAAGRELWQSRLFIWHLAVQALVAGGAAFVLIESASGAEFLDAVMLRALGGFVLLHGLMMMGEWSGPASSENLREAIAAMTHGTNGLAFWGVANGLGVAAVIALVLMANRSTAPGLAIAAAALALVGLLAYEFVWITAGQAPALS